MEHKFFMALHFLFPKAMFLTFLFYLCLAVTSASRVTHLFDIHSEIYLSICQHVNRILI